MYSNVTNNWIGYYAITKPGFNKLAQMIKSPDFTAELQFFTTEQGGRKTPVFTNYFPQVKFAFSIIHVGGRQKFLNKTIVYPGEDVVAEITLLMPETFNGKLKV